MKMEETVPDMLMMSYVIVHLVSVGFFVKTVCCTYSLSVSHNNVHTYIIHIFPYHIHADICYTIRIGSFTIPQIKGTACAQTIVVLMMSIKPWVGSIYVY